MGLIGGLVAAGGALSGLFGGGGAGSVQLPPQFNMPNMSGAANNAYGGIGNLGNYTGVADTAMPYANQTFQNLYNNPYSGGFQSGANTASGLGMNAALGSYGAGANLTGASTSLLPYANNIMQAGFDPQQQLYNQQFNQNLQQTQAASTAAGVGTTPYGAGLTNMSNQNFNTAWENQQLGREATAAGAAGGLVNQAGQGIGTGTGIMNAAPAQYLNAASYPYATSTGILGQQQGAISNLLGTGASAANLQNIPIQDYLSYIGAGNQAGSVANQQAQLALQQQQQGFNQNMLYSMALGGGLANIGKYGGGFGGFGGTSSGTSFLPGSSFMSGNVIGI